jgi:hypothetical protein
MKNCCNHTKKDKRCIRKSDKKTFSLPRKFTYQQCKKGIRGFTMRSSCAPYKDCIKTKRQLPQLRKIDKSNKKHIYKLLDPQTKRILAINEGIRDEMKKGKSKYEAALSKKKRFNVLRMYRKNKDKKGCERLTQDMKYLDKTYKTGTTNNICIQHGGTSKKKFLYNPDNPKKSFDVYIDKNPKDTIPIKYTTLQDVKDTIKKLERLYKQGEYPHKRIWQVAMIMKVRLNVLKKTKPKQYSLSKRYYEHLKRRTKIKGEKDRKKYRFKV